MGKPAARIGDMTAHGGAIVVGCPTVLIGGMPAARVGDMHVCPMMNPPPSPHVGGPIAMGSPMVLIGGMPAARMGDMAVCAGPPDTIMLGCMTVLIGEGGSGAASGGGAGMSAAASAQASAAVAQAGGLESITKREHWVEFKFVDKAGLPVSGIQYKFTDPAGKESEGVLKTDGKISRDAIQQGQCKVELFSVSNAKWSKAKADVGEKVKMSAAIDGYGSGFASFFEIYSTDLHGRDFLLETIQAVPGQNQVEAEWQLVYPEQWNDPEELSNYDTYTHPKFYFVLHVGQCTSRSALLEYEDSIEIEVSDEGGNPLPNLRYELLLSNGAVRKGVLDAQGKGMERKVPPTKYHVVFPDEDDLHLRG